MKKYLILISVLFLFQVISSGQVTDPLISKCAMSTGPGTTYLKDFRVQLGKANTQSGLRYKQVLSFSKNMRYRFTLCDAENSNSVLVMKLMDKTGRQVLSSYDQKSGKTFPSIEFVCNKTDTYQIYFDFLNFQQGLGVGIISLVK